MKKTILTLTVVSLFTLGTLAFAHGTGGWGGGHMMNQGYGGHMGGRANQGNIESRSKEKFLDETADLRKELHSKKFEYAEATRGPDVNRKTIRQLEKEIYELEEKIYDKSPRTSRGYGGY